MMDVTDKQKQVHIKIGDATIVVPSGTVIGTLLPQAINNFPVVAALLNHKAVALSACIFIDAVITPLTTEHWEGERIYRRSAALLLLVALEKVAPHLDVRLGPSMGSTQWIDINSSEEMDWQQLAEETLQVMRDLAEQKIPFFQERWFIEEALDYFCRQNRSSLELLKTWRRGKVSLTRCDNSYFIKLGPLAPDAGLIRHFNIQPTQCGLVLTTDPREVPSFFASYVQAMHRHDLWLRSLNVDSVGKFNQSCINGKVADTIRVAEGFHEKKLSQIADQIAAKSDTIRVICIAGPSASGKTTFIKRLKVQLQVNGLKPIDISLDNYYLDRHKIPRDPKGDYDFECLEALNLQMLQQQLQQLLQGKPLNIAHFDFKSGKSHPHGGHKLQLDDNHILLLEGIHGLNPKLIADIAKEQLYRIFIQPMTSLAFDRLSRVNPSDTRLLRRIVRDRRQRGFSAADNILRWPAVRAGEKENIFPFVEQADSIFDSSLIYEISVIKVYAERYLLEVPRTHPAFTTAYRLRKFIDHFVAIYPDHVPQNSIIREFIGGSGFEY